MTITLTGRHDPEATRRILDSLPTWFGIPEANEHYARAAGEKDSYLALADGRVLVPQRSEKSIDGHGHRCSLPVRPRASPRDDPGKSTVLGSAVEVVVRDVRDLSQAVLGARPHRG